MKIYRNGVIGTIIRFNQYAGFVRSEVHVIYGQITAIGKCTNAVVSPAKCIGS